MRRIPFKELIVGLSIFSVVSMLIVCLVLSYGLGLYLIIETEIQATNHLPRIQKAVEEQCGAEIEVNREGFEIDDGTTWSGVNGQGYNISCRYDQYSDLWSCRC